MKFGRAVGITAAAALAAGGCLLAATSAGSAATTPPTPIALGATGMSSAACPLPVNGTLAFKPGTTMQFKPDLVLALGQQLTLTVLSEAQTTPAQQPKNYTVAATGTNVAFPSTGTYDLTWKTNAVLGVLGISQKGKLVFNSSVQGCQVAVQLPVPSVSVPGVPSSVTSPINGILSSAVGGINGALSPVNSAVGPIIGGLPGGLTGGGPNAGVPAGGSDPGTNYKPTGPTVAQRTVPQGYGNGNGAAGLYVPSNGGSINAPAAGFTGAGAGGAGKAGSSAPVKSGGSPHTVDLASNKPRSALEGWSALIVVLALVALSGATAFYARTFLLQPAPATN